MGRRPHWSRRDRQGPVINTQREAGRCVEPDPDLSGTPYGMRRFIRGGLEWSDPQSQRDGAKPGVRKQASRHRSEWQR